LNYPFIFSHLAIWSYGAFPCLVQNSGTRALGHGKSRVVHLHRRGDSYYFRRGIPQDVMDEFRYVAIKYTGPGIVVPKIEVWQCIGVRNSERCSAKSQHSWLLFCLSGYLSIGNSSDFLPI